MTYAHILDGGAVDQVGRPPATAYAQGRWWDLRPLDLPTLAQAGWFPLVEVSRPADTDTHTSDLSYAVVAGQPTQVWTVRPWTAEELAARTADSNRGTLLARISVALQNNSTYLGLGSPTAAQNTAQVKALTRQVNALMRLVGNQLDTTDNT